MPWPGTWLYPKKDNAQPGENRGGHQNIEKPSGNDMRLGREKQETGGSDEQDIID
jgi:hypothetical protein